MKFTRPSRSAFSLVEILVVVAIIGIIASFAVPAADKMIRGTDVTRAAQMVNDAFTTARQTAIARNKQIEMRIIRFADPELPGESVDDESTWKIRGFQLMEVTSSGIPVQLAPMQRLPGQMMMHDGKYSSLVDLNNTISTQKALKFIKPTQLDPPMPRVATEKARKYTYASFRFMPDGSTTLTMTGNWFLTVISAQDMVKLAAPSTDKDPIKTVNYFIIQVDPVNGSTRNFRPTLG